MSFSRVSSSGTSASSAPRQSQTPSGAKSRSNTSRRRDKAPVITHHSKELCTSHVWLTKHGLKAKGITSDLIEDAATMRLQTLQENLTALAQDYNKRLEWLLSPADGKKTFGSIVEDKVLLLIDHTFDDWGLVEKALHPILEEQLQSKKRVVMISVDTEGAQANRVNLEGNQRGGMKEFDADELQNPGERMDQMFQYLSQLGRKINRPGSSFIKDFGDSVGSKVAGTAQGMASVLSKASGGINDIVSSLGGRGKRQDGHVGSDKDSGERVTNKHGPNIFHALETAFNEVQPKNRSEDRHVDGIYLIVGHQPKHSLSSIEGALQRLFVGKDTPLTVVNLGDFTTATDRYLRSIVSIYNRIATNLPYPSRYHVMDTSENGLPPGDDLHMILEEQDLANKFLERVEARYQEIQTHNARVRLPGRKKETKKKTAMTPAKPTRGSRFRAAANRASKKDHQYLGRLAATQKLQVIEYIPSNTTDVPGSNLTSRLWLKTNGLKYKKLSLYQEFQDVAFTCSKPGLFMGQSYKTMGTIPWHDGSQKTMHIDIGQMASYRDRLVDQMKIINDRISWLGTGSRRVFGNFSGNNITFVIDTSSNLELMKEHIKSLFQEHLMNMNGWFNLVKLDNKPERFRFDMTEVSDINLNEAWEWVESWKCKSCAGRDLKNALQLAVDSLRPQVHGEHMIVLVCAGLPDQPDSEICRFATQMLADGSTTVNTVGYNCCENPEVIFLLREIARITGGEFQLCVESGTVHDRLHGSNVSWSTDSTLVYDEAEQEFDNGKILDHYYEIARWVKLSGALPEPHSIDKDGTLSERLKSTVNQVDTQAGTICLCDGTDSQTLRREVFKGKEYLNILDEVVKSLPPPYDQMAYNVLRGVEVPKPIKEAWEQEATDPNAPGNGPMLTKSAKMRATHTLELIEKRRREAEIKATKEQLSTKKISGTGAGERMNRYLAKPIEPQHTEPEPLVKPSTNQSVWQTFETSKVWLKRHGLKAMRLTISQYKKSCGYGSKSKSATVSVRHWDTYIKEVKKARNMYLRRKKWLAEGDHKMFGIVPEKNVVFAIDTSGSMEVFMEDMIETMTNLVHALPGKVQKFNVLKFSDTVETFSEEHKYGLIQANQAICACYESWIKTWEAFGGTNIRDALREASKDKDCEAVYLLSDGLPNESTLDIEQKTLVKQTDGKLVDCFCPDIANCTCGPGDRYPSIRELGAIGVKVHTISFNAGHDDPSSGPKINEFLKMIARGTNGRYHEFKSLFSRDGSVVLGSGAASGDDIDMLQNEIEYADNLIAAAQSGKNEAEERIRAMLDAREKNVTKKTAPWVPNGTKRELPPKNQAVSSPRNKVKMPTPRPTRGSILLQQVNSVRSRPPPKFDDFESDSESDGRQSDDIMFTSDDESLIDEMQTDRRVLSTKSIRGSIKNSAPTKSVYKQVFTSSVGLLSAPVNLASEPDKQNFAMRKPAEYRSIYPRFRAFISDLNPQTTPSQLLRFFCKELRVQLSKGDIDMPWDEYAEKPGLPVAYVTFKSRADLLSALRLSGKVLGGRNIRITTASDPAFDTTLNPDELVPEIRGISLA